jgi:hypothetical protein
MGLLGLVMVFVVMPDNAGAKMETTASLPQDWGEYPYGSATVSFIQAELLRSRECL